MASFAPFPIELVSPQYRGLFSHLWRRRGRFTIVFVSVLGLMILALVIIPSRFYASGAVMIVGPEPLPTMVSDAASATWQQRIGDPPDLDSNLLEITSPRLLRTVVATPEAIAAIKAECEARRSGYIHQSASALRVYLPRSIETLLPAHHGCDEITGDVALKLDWVTSHYTAAVVGRSRVIQVGYTSQVAATAQTMANFLINSYLDDEREKRVGPRDTGVLWLRQEIARLGAVLAQDDKRIQEFRRSHGLLQGQYAAITSEELTETMRLLASAQVERALAAAQVIELDRGDGADAPAILGSHTIEDLKRQDSEITARLANLSQKFAPNNAILAPLQRERDEVERQLSSEINRIRASIHRTYEARKSEVVALTEELATLKLQAASASDFDSQIAGMVRDAEVKRALYIELSKRANELQTEREVLSASSQLVNLAELPLRPSFPKPVPFGIGGVAVASILATLAALRRDGIDHQIQSPDLLHTLTHLPIMANVPMVSGSMTVAGYRSLSLSRVLANLREPSTLQEAFRRIHAQIGLARPRGSIRTLLVTSSNEQEGKSLVALGIAQFAAATGKRVLVIECDLRKPSLDAALGLPGRQTSAGLSAYLSGKAENVPVNRIAENFDVVFAGEASIASTELLSGSRFADVLRVAENYDLVLLDSPPCDLLMDARVIAPQVDGMIFCARWGQTAPEELAANLETLKEIGGKIIGLVVTFTPNCRQPPYGYGQKRLVR